MSFPLILIASVGCKDPVEEPDGAYTSSLSVEGNWATTDEELENWSDERVVVETTLTILDPSVVRFTTGDAAVQTWEIAADGPGADELEQQFGLECLKAGSTDIEMRADLPDESWGEADHWVTLTCSVPDTDSWCTEGTGYSVAGDEAEALFWQAEDALYSGVLDTNGCTTLIHEEADDGATRDLRLLYQSTDLEWNEYPHKGQQAWLAGDGVHSVTQGPDTDGTWKTFIHTHDQQGDVVATDLLDDGTPYVTFSVGGGTWVSLSTGSETTLIHAHTGESRSVETGPSAYVVGVLDDARKVLFESYSALDDDDTNGSNDCYLTDVETGQVDWMTRHLDAIVSACKILDEDEIVVSAYDERGTQENILYAVSLDEVRELKRGALGQVDIDPPSRLGVVLDDDELVVIDLDSGDEQALDTQSGTYQLSGMFQPRIANGVVVVPARAEMDGEDQGWGTFVIPISTF